MSQKRAYKIGFALCAAITLAGCGGIREHVRSKDFRDDSPAARQTGTPSPVANVPDMPGWTTDVDAAIAFATENPQRTVLFVQQSGDPSTESIKTILNSADAESALADKQKVTLNTATAADVIARFGVSRGPAVVMLGPGGIPESQKTGKMSKTELLKYLK